MPDVRALVWIDGDGQISPEEFAAALLNEKLLGTEGVSGTTTGDRVNSYEEVISQIGSTDEGTKAFDKLDGTTP